MSARLWIIMEQDDEPPPPVEWEARGPPQRSRGVIAD